VAGQPEKLPSLDRETLRDLARCFARAAVDDLIASSQGKETNSLAETARSVKSPKTDDKK
jgi:hypothetical protein